MAQIPSNQGAPQASNIAVQDALPLIGSLSRENGQTVLNSIDADLAKLFEDRNILLAEGGTLAWSTTTNNLTFSAALKLHINSQIAGGSPTVIDLTNTTRAFSADNRMLYAVINRIAGTATVTADASSLPSVVAANIEVVLIAKRISGQIYFRNGFNLASGQTAVLGRQGSVIDTEFVINDSTDPTKQLVFDAAGTTGTKTTITGSQTANRVQTLQDATDTFVYRATTDSLSNKQVGFSSSTDSTTTGSNSSLQAFTTGIVRLTNSSLISLSGIPAGSSGQFLVIENKTGNQIIINNEETTPTAANRIQTGANANISMPNNASFAFTYDSTSSRWQLTGGSGSGGGSSGSGKNYLSAITTSQSSTPNTGNGNFETGSTVGFSLFNTTLNYNQSLTFTVTIASPAVFTSSSAHSLSVGQSIYFTTTGALPTGLTANQTYYVSAVPSTTTFKVSATLGGSDVNTSGTQSGTHTYFANPQLTTGSISAGASSITTFGVVSSGQLSGSYSLETAASSSLTRGQGFITDAFYVDQEDQAKRLSFKFYYKVVSGSPVMASSQANTFAVYLYDVTNAVWIQPTGCYGMGQGSGVGLLTGDFQTSSNGTQYRLAVVCINSLSSAVDMYWDDFQVGPTPVVYGAAITDWTSYVMTGSFTNSTYTAQYRRIGDMMQVQGKIAITGTPGAGTLTVSLPPGYSIDTSKLVEGTTTNRTLPNSEAWFVASANGYLGNVTYNSPTQVQFTANQGATTSNITNIVTNAIPANFVNGDLIDFSFFVPIQGWSSNVQMSSDTDTRLVDFTGTQASQAVTAGVTDIVLTATKDTHSVWTGSQYKVSVAGDYWVSASFLSSANNTLQAYVNGVAYDGFYLTSTGTSGFAGAGARLLVNLKAGDLISIRGNTSTTLSSISVSIYKTSSPSAIAATETIAASYWCSANTAASTTSPINFDSKEFDTHGAVTTGSGWRFTAPAAGLYDLQGFFSAIDGLTTAWQVFKNGSAYKSLATTIAAYDTTVISSVIKLNAQDYIDFRPSGARTIQGGVLSSTNFVSYVYISLRK